MNFTYLHRMVIDLFLIMNWLSEATAHVPLDVAQLYQPLKYQLNQKESNKGSSRYSANWTSLDSRPLPQWYDDAKIGIFIHWGVFSVPSYGSEWFWNYWKKGIPDYVQFMQQNYPPDFTYQDFAAQFTAEFFDPVQWAEVFNAAGAKYVVLTTKHHEGYTLWPSKYSWNWNAKDVGPKMDIVGDLKLALELMSPKIKFGLYHSLAEWFNPEYLQDCQNNYTTNTFPSTKTMPELYELVEQYQPSLIWSDGPFDGPDWYWNSTVFLAWLFNDSPVHDQVVVNDRWGNNVLCKHGSYYTCHDRWNPGVLQDHKWENAMSLDKHSWGYRREAKVGDFLTIHELLEQLVSTVSCGGNLLINIGPTHEGIIPLIMEERLRQLGQWLEINGEAIYNTRPWAVQNDTDTKGVWYTRRNETVYALVLAWPKENILTLGSLTTTSNVNISMLGYDQLCTHRWQHRSNFKSRAIPDIYVVTCRW
ncbi:unnamed protein product, partial [Meganyctiphanes norvegica]